MFARRTLALGALAFAGFAGTASADTPAAKPATTPAATAPTTLPTTVVTQSTPVSTERTRRFGLRRTRTTTAPVVTASYVAPMTKTETKIETTKPTTTAAATTETAPVMTATTMTTTGRTRTARTGLFSRLMARR